MPKQKVKTQKASKTKTQSGAGKLTTGAEQLAVDQTEKQSELVRQKPQCLEDILKDQPVYVNSIASGLLGLDRGSILREMQQARASMLRYFLSDAGGKKTVEEALKLVNAPPDDDFTERELQRVLSEPISSVSWWQLEQIYERAPQVTKDVWQFIKDEACDELKSGHRIAATAETAAWQRDPWPRAQFLAIRNGFVEEWQPKGGIELALIDMMAQAFSAYLYWCEVAHHRATTEGKLLYSAEEEIRAERAKGHWIPPRLGEYQAIEHASQMADRYNRLFLRTLRQLRDLRRYSTPVTINNPKQVNIATDGGKQVNVSKDEPGDE